MKKGLIGYIVPFGIPEVVRHANAFAARRTGDASRGEGQAALDERVGLDRRRRPRPRRASSRRESTCSGRTWTARQAGAVAEDEGRPVGRLRLDARKIGAEAVADGGDLQLGAVLREAGQGCDERNVEARLLLRHDQGRVHEHRSRTARRSAAKTKAAIAAKKKAIVAGKFNVFTGPIYDQAGKVGRAEG